MVANHCCDLCRFVDEGTAEHARPDDGRSGEQLSEERFDTQRSANSATRLQLIGECRVQGYKGIGLLSSFHTCARGFSFPSGSRFELREA